jgi:predicted O-methyltransferase YrrM
MVYSMVERSSSQGPYKGGNTTMSDFPPEIPPLSVRAQAIADEQGFRISSEPRTGAMLRVLAASKPAARILEVGAGTGVGAGWLLAGMDPEARLTALELAPDLARLCGELLADDPRAEVVRTDATTWLEQYSGPPFDLVFVDTMEHKFHRRDLVFAHMSDGAIFVADDLLPSDTWSAAHPAAVEQFRKEILSEPDLVATLCDWSSGLLIAAYRDSTRRSASR